MKTTPGSRYPLFHNHNKDYTPPSRPSLLKSVFFEANSSSSIIRTGRGISLHYSREKRERERERAVAEEQSQLSQEIKGECVDRGQTRPSMKPLSTRTLSRQSRPLDSIIDRLNSLFTHRINPPIESRSVYYNNNIRASNRFELRDNSSLVMTARSGNCFQTTVRSVH